MYITMILLQMTIGFEEILDNDFKIWRTVDYTSLAKQRSATKQVESVSILPRCTGCWLHDQN